MAKPNTILFSLSPSDRGAFVTKKEAKAQVREALGNAGLKLGLFTKVNKIVNDKVIDVFSASLTIDESVVVTVIRGIGNPVTINVTKAKLKKLVAAAKAVEAGKAKTKPAAKPAAKPVPTPVVTEDAGLPATMEEFIGLGMDQVGELLALAPRKGGLTVKQLREILHSDDIDTKGLNREDLIRCLLDGAEYLTGLVDLDEDEDIEDEDIEDEAEESNVLTLSGIMDDLRI